MDTVIILDTATVNQTWCAFEHLAQFEEGKPPEVVFVNAGPITEVFRMLEGRRNSEWLRIFQNGGSVMIRIMFQSTDRVEVMRFAMKYAKSLTTVPRCTLHGVNIKGMARRIRCSNGQMYDSQKQAADALAIQASAISRHMRGDLRQVGGYTFLYEDFSEVSI